MKKGLLFLVSLWIISCNNYSSKKNNNKFTSTTNYTLNGTIDFNAKTAYLNKIRNDSLFKIDSSSVVNNVFIFKGTIISPERFALTFKNYSAVVIVILEHKDFSISIKKHHLNDPVIIGSPLNSQLLNYKTSSKNIFKKVDYLYPQFQKARLENDVQKLQEIKQKMDSIEAEFSKYSFNFIKENRNSYIAAMILSDHLKTTKINFLKIKNSFNLLSKQVQNSVDGKRIANWLQLH